MSKLKIIVIHSYVHQHFGGDKQDIHEFEMSEGERAEVIFNSLSENDNSGYSHTTISVMTKF
jgi:hypothetical protein